MVKARLPGALRDQPAAQSSIVHIRREPGLHDGSAQYAGSVAGSARASDGDERSVRGQTCQEVVEALALIAALGLERAAKAFGPEPRSEWLSTTVEVPVDESATSTAASSLEPFDDPRWGFTVFTAVDTATAPRWALNVGLGIAVEWSTATWQPWLSLGVYTGKAQTVRLPDQTATAQLERWSTHSVACPWRWPATHPVALRPCLDLDIGALRGVGVDVAGARHHSGIWASSGLELRLEASTSPWLRLDATLGGIASMLRPRFYFQPGVTAFEVPAFGFRAGFSASLML
jgi:hypothetical protein